MDRHYREVLERKDAEIAALTARAEKAEADTLVE